MPDRLYQQISDLLFGGDKGAPGALVTTAQRMAEEENEQLARRRFGRRFTRRRQADVPDERPGGGSAPSQLDAILADRDTLLADRDDPDGWDGGGWQRPPGRSTPYDRPPSYDQPAYDRPPSYDQPAYGQPPSYGERDWGGEEPYPRPSDPTARVHQPRRGDSSGRSQSSRPDAPQAPSGQAQDQPPPGNDPADD